MKAQIFLGAATSFGMCKKASTGHNIPVEAISRVGQATWPGLPDPASLIATKEILTEGKACVNRHLGFLETEKRIARLGGVGSAARRAGIVSCERRAGALRGLPFGGSNAGGVVGNWACGSHLGTEKGHGDLLRLGEAAWQSASVDARCRMGSPQASQRLQVSHHGLSWCSRMFLGAGVDTL